MMFRVLALLGILLISISARAEDWPRFRGPDNNGISKETGLLKTWPAGGPKVLWTAPIGKGFSSCSVVAGRVYTMDQDAEGQWVNAFDEKTGARVWRTQTGKPYEDMDNFDGPRCTPTIENGRIWALDGNGEAVCLNQADGKLIWKKNILALAKASNNKWGIAQSPFIYNDKVLFNPGGNSGAAFIALNKLTGAVVWRSGDGIGSYATPVISKAGGVEHVVFVDGTDLVGLDPNTGKILWKYPWPSLNELNAVSPVAWDDKVFISGGYHHGAAVVKLDMKAANPATEVWQSRSMQCYFQLPILLGGYLYGYSWNTAVCIDTNGNLKWSDDDGQLPSRGQMVYADGLFYIYGEGGDAALAKLTPAGPQVLCKFDLSPGRSRWAIPTVANGHLYLRDDQKLYCLDVKAVK